MLARFAPAVLAFVALPFAACGGGPSPAATGQDAGATFSVPRDAAPPDAAPFDAKTPWARLEPHQHKVLNRMRLMVVYIGDEPSGGAQSFDAFVDWLLMSDYWGIMQQYGVGKGTRVTSMRVPLSSVIPDGAVTKGLITAEDLEAAVRAAIHPEGADAGADASDEAGIDASDEAGIDASDEAGIDAGQPPPTVSLADAYIFFLPVGVNVNLGQRGNHVFQTCIDAGGYHAFDGVEPYAIIPPCTLGRSALAVSHELAEMATDPFPSQGWYSPKDEANGGGEIGDLCNQIAPHGADGWDITQLWSNADGDCEPN
jgi:hypothetical protein